MIFSKWICLKPQKGHFSCDLPKNIELFVPHIIQVDIRRQHDRRIVRLADGSGRKSYQKARLSLFDFSSQVCGQIVTFLLPVVVLRQEFAEKRRTGGEHDLKREKQIIWIISEGHELC